MFAAGVATQKGFKAAVGSQANTTSNTTISMTTTAPIAVGDLIVVRAAADNQNATLPTFTCADSGGNSYTTHRQGSVNATALAGVAGAIMVSKATTAIATGGSITVTLSSAQAARCAIAQTFVGFQNTLRVAAVGSSGASTAATSGASASANAGDLALGFTASENNNAITGDSDTSQGVWSTAVTLFNASGGTATGRVQISGQYKVLTGAGAQTFDQTVPNSEWVCGLIIMQAT